MTKPFLSDEFVLEKVLIDYNTKRDDNIEITKIESLYNWIHLNVEYNNPNSNKKYGQFDRTAKEIWDSKVTKGCTDYALLFATFARQIGIPTTILQTAELGWLQRFKHNEDYRLHLGHFFCECYYNGKWILVDPTTRKIEEIYYPKKIELSYNVGKNNVFIPFLRSLDSNKKQTIVEYNIFMEQKCKNLISSDKQSNLY